MSSLLGCLSAFHQAAFNILFWLRSRGWPGVTTIPRPRSPHIILSGFFGETLGLGTAARLTYDALKRLGLKITSQDLRPLHSKLLSGRAHSFVDGIQANIWIVHANPPEARIALYKLDPSVWKDLYRIGCWVWETDVAPADWALTAKWFHEIWVPSESVYSAFASTLAHLGRASEIKKFRVIPYAVGVQPQTLEVENVGVTALTLFDPRSDLDRKNPAGAITAWRTAFPSPQPQTYLIVKALFDPGNAQGLDLLRQAIADRPDISLRVENLSPPDTLKLISECDILISLHRAEGFGLTLAEAMAAGNCVIATGWSGNMQFMTSENSLLVPFDLVAAKRSYNGPQARWADPDLEAAARILKLATNDASLRAALGKQARQDITKLMAHWKRDRLLPDQ